MGTASSTITRDSESIQSVFQLGLVLLDNCCKGDVAPKIVNSAIPNATCFCIKEQKLWKCICMTLRTKKYLSCLNIKDLS